MAAARALIEKASATGRELLTEPESKELLSLYGIPSVETRIVADGQERDSLEAEAEELRANLEAYRDMAAAQGAGAGDAGGWVDE